MYWVFNWSDKHFALLPLLQVHNWKARVAAPRHPAFDPHYCLLRTSRSDSYILSIYMRNLYSQGQGAPWFATANIEEHLELTSNCMFRRGGTQDDNRQCTWCENHVIHQQGKEERKIEADKWNTGRSNTNKHQHIRSTQAASRQATCHTFQRVPTPNN